MENSLKSCEPELLFDFFLKQGKTHCTEREYTKMWGGVNVLASWEDKWFWWHQDNHKHTHTQMHK